MSVSTLLHNWVIILTQRLTRLEIGTSSLCLEPPSAQSQVGCPGTWYPDSLDDLRGLEAWQVPFMVLIMPFSHSGCFLMIHRVSRHLKRLQCASTLSQLCPYLSKCSLCLGLWWLGLACKDRLNEGFSRSGRPVSMSVKIILIEAAHLFPYCGWHHSLGLDPGLYREEKVN